VYKKPREARRVAVGVGGDERINTAECRIEHALVLPAREYPITELVTVVSGTLHLGDAVPSADDLLHADVGKARDGEAIETVEFLVTAGHDWQLWQPGCSTTLSAARLARVGALSQSPLIMVRNSWRVA
jgi:hypothetical protein